MLRRMVATGLLTAVAGAAQALPLFWIQQDCTTCSPVARDGVGSLAPFAPPAQLTSHGTADGALAVETTQGSALAGSVAALASTVATAGSINIIAGGATSTAAFFLQTPVTAPAGAPAGAAFPVSFNFVIDGSVFTQAGLAFPSSSLVVMAARTFLSVNVDPSTFVPALRSLGFNIMDNAGDYHSFGNGTVFGTGVFSGLGLDGSFLANATTPTIMAHQGDVLTFGLGLFAQVSETIGSGTGTVSADLSHTLRLATDRPVFNLPPGWTVNSPDGVIVDNRFMPGAATPPVPEPATSATLAGGLALTAWFMRRQRRRAAAA